MITLYFIFISSFIVFFFKKWLGPLGSFFILQFFTALSFFWIIWLYFFNIQQACTLVVDLGYWLQILDLLEIHMCFIFDALSLTLGGLVLFLTLLIQHYSLEYLYREAFCSRFLYLLQFFVFSVLLLFTVYDYFLLLLAWELIGLFSLLLVNFYYIRVYTIKAAFKTFIFSRISDFFMLLPLFIFILCFQSTDFSIIFISIPFFLFYFIFIGSFSINLLSLLALFLVLGGGIKGAQFISHVWLPDAMEAPTPASALIHSSTLVIMGIYVFIRFGILFEFTPWTAYFMSIWGSITILLGSISAVFQSDLKKLIAYSTISQIGYLCCGCGFLCFAEVLDYLIVHALNKALIFIFAGHIIHASFNNTDMRLISSLFNRAEDSAFFMLFLTLSLSGLPLSAGFFTKELLLLQTFSHSPWFIFTKIAWLLGIFFTLMYFTVLIDTIFFNERSFTVTISSIYNKRTLFFFNTLPINYYFYRLSDWTILYSKATPLFYLLFFWITQLFGELVFFSNQGVLLLSQLQQWTSTANNTYISTSSLTSYYWFFWLKLWVFFQVISAFRYFTLAFKS